MKKSLSLSLFFIFIIGCKTSEKNDASSAPQAVSPCAGLSVDGCKLQALQCVFTPAQNKCELKPYLACEKLTAATCTTVPGCAVDKVTSFCTLPKNCADMDIDECGHNLRKCQYDQTAAKCSDPALAVNLPCEQRLGGNCVQDGKCMINTQTGQCVGTVVSNVSNPLNQSYPSVCAQLPNDQPTCQQKLNCCAWTGSTCAEKFTYSATSFNSTGQNCGSAPDINTCLRGQGFANNCSWSRTFNKCVMGNLCRVDINVCRCLPHCDISEVGTCMVR